MRWSNALPSELARWRQTIASLPGQIDAVRRAFTGTVHSAREPGSLRRDQHRDGTGRRSGAENLDQPGDLTASSELAFAELPLADIRRVCEILGGTTNDVVLACAAGAFREFFANAEANS